MSTCSEHTQCASNFTPPGVSSYSSKHHDEKNSDGDTEIQSGHTARTQTQAAPRAQLLNSPYTPLCGVEHERPQNHKRNPPPKFTIDGDKAGRHGPATWRLNSTPSPLCITEWLPLQRNYPLQKVCGTSPASPKRNDVHYGININTISELSSKSCISFPTQRTPISRSSCLRGMPHPKEVCGFTSVGNQVQCPQQITICALNTGHPQRMFSFPSICSFQLGIRWERWFCSWSIFCF